MSVNEVTNEERHQMYREQAGHPVSPEKSVTVTHDVIKKGVIVAVCAVVAVFLVGNFLIGITAAPSSAAEPSGGNEAAFMEAVRSAEPATTTSADESLLTFGYAYCAALNSGTTVDQATLNGNSELVAVGMETETAARLIGVIGGGAAAGYAHNIGPRLRPG